MPLSRCLHFSHGLVSLVFPLAHRSMRISVVCNFLSSFFLTAQHSAPYTMAGFIAVLYTLSFNFVGMFLLHITPVVSLHFDQAIFTLLFTSFSAPPLASNIEPRYLNIIMRNYSTMIYFHKRIQYTRTIWVHFDMFLVTYTICLLCESRHRKQLLVVSHYS